MPRDPRDYKVEISGALASPSPCTQGEGRGEGADAAAPACQGASASARPFLSVHFACCGVYCRVYRNSEGTAYVGQCPRCAKLVRFRVGREGTDQRFFVVE